MPNNLSTHWGRFIFGSMISYVRGKWWAGGKDFFLKKNIVFYREIGKRISHERRSYLHPLWLDEGWEIKMIGVCSSNFRYFHSKKLWCFSQIGKVWTMSSTQKREYRWIFLPPRVFGVICSSRKKCISWWPVGNLLHPQLHPNSQHPIYGI